MAAEVLLNPRLREFLRQLHQAEEDARGSQRRDAFRRTRDAIGAALALGIPGRELADCFGVTVASVRNRVSESGSTMTPNQLERLTRLHPDAISHLTGSDLQPVNDGLSPHYLVSDVVQALQTHPR